MSIILVGMGKGDFSYLDDELSSADNMIRDRHGRIITRDFVQCATYNNLKEGKLAEQVLREIPD